MALAAGDVVCRPRIIREGSHDVIVIDDDVNIGFTPVVELRDSSDFPNAGGPDWPTNLLTEPAFSDVDTPAANNALCIEAQHSPVAAHSSSVPASDRNRRGQGPVAQPPSVGEASPAGSVEASYSQRDMPGTVVPSEGVTAGRGDQVTSAAAAGTAYQLDESAQQPAGAEADVRGRECEPSACEVGECHTVAGGSPAAPAVADRASVESMPASAERLFTENSNLPITVMDAVINQETGVANAAALVQVRRCMSDEGLMMNQGAFECSICFSQVPTERGVVLRACLHQFCRNCLSNTVKYCERIKVPCPFANLPEVSCSGCLLDGEIAALVSKEILHQRRVLAMKLAGYDRTTGEVWPSLMEATVSGRLAANSVRFECPVCFAAVAPNAGAVLKDCLHSFCRSCLADVINSSSSDRIPCPCTSSDYTCDGHLLEEEMRALVSPQQYVQYLARSLGTVSRWNRPMLEQLEAAGEQQLTPNVDPFHCGICLSDVEPAGGVTLQECLHSFCRPCLASLVTHCDDACVKCPFVGENYSCQCPLMEREIRALVSPEVYEKHLQWSLRLAESSTTGAFHCRSPGCAGWCELEDTVHAFCCPVCQKVNCISCRAIHEELDCRQYQTKLREDARHNREAQKTQAYINEMLNKGEAILCPICGIVIMKKSGCDLIRCSACRKDVCWRTGKPRWGPRGQGDISGGCKCGVNNRRCHPNCKYCH